MGDKEGVVAEENIFIFHVNDAYSSFCEVPIRQIDPYQYTHIRFVDSRNDVLGYADYWTVYKRSGSVAINFLSSTAIRKKLNGDIYDEDEEKEKKDGLVVNPSHAEQFYSCAFFFKEIPQHFFNVESTLRKVDARISWILNGMLEYPGREVKPEYDVTAVLWCSTISMLMRRINVPNLANYTPSVGVDERKARQKHYLGQMKRVDRLISLFEQQRLIMEKRTFSALLNPFLQEGNESHLLQFLINQGLSKETLRANYIVEGTLDDSRTTLQRLLYKTSIYVRVKLVEVPTEVSSLLPVYPGGYVHLHPKDVEAWLWQRCVTVWKHLNNNLWSSPAQSIDNRLFFIANQTYARLKGIDERRKLRKEYSKSNDRDVPEGPSITGVDASILPACLRYERWVKDGERLQVLYQMRKANVDIEDCAKILHSFHLKEDSGATMEKTRGKWDVMQYQNTPIKSMRAQGCSRFIDNRNKSECLVKCPYKSPNVDGCKKECVDEFRARFKSPPPWITPEKLFAPSQYIRWTHKAIKYEEEHFS